TEYTNKPSSQGLFCCNKSLEHGGPATANCSSSQGLPKVVCVKEARELLVHVDDVDVALAVVAHHGTGPLAVAAVALNVDAQAAIHLEPQEDLIIDGVLPPAAAVPS